MRKALIKDKRVEQKLMEKKQKEAYELVPELKRQIEELTYELGQTEKQLESRVKDTEILQKLYQNGVIDVDGNRKELIKL